MEEEKSRRAPGERLQGALQRLKLADSQTEIYPEDYEKRPLKRFKKEFSTNSTFVAFTHLIRAMMGPTILAIPRGFRLGGVALSPPGFFFLLALATYNMRRLILDAAFLSEKENISVRTYDEVAYVAFNRCSNYTRRYAKILKICINIFFFVTYLDACVIFMIFISRNLEAIVCHYLPESFLGVRYFIFLQVILHMMMSSLRQLKQLSPFSLIASILLITVIIILVSFYFSRDLDSTKGVYLVGTATGITHYICVVLFCMSGISIALTLKSSMKHPEHFMSFPGIFYISIFAIFVLFTSFGTLGYMKYGTDTEPSVLLNVPFTGVLSVCVKLFAVVSVLFTSPLVFYVAFNVLWNNFLKQFFSQVNVLFSEYCVRYSLIIITCFTAMAFPDLGKMIVLKGALFHTHLELTIPAVVDYVAHYPELGSGRGHYRLIVMILISGFGMACCVGGIVVSILDWKNAQ